MNSFRKQFGQPSLNRACAVAVLVISIAAMFPVWNQLLTIALHDEEASHLLLVPFVFGWLMWCSRDRLQTTVSQSGWGLVVIGVAIVLHEVGLRTNLQVLWHASAILCLVGAIWLIVGLETIRRVWPAIAVLLFLIPIPGLLRQQISLPIQMCSAAITETILSLAGTNIRRSGCVLSVDGTAITVAEACNGMRMLFAVLLVVYAMAFSLSTRRTSQFAILILSPLLAMALNVVRLSVSVWMFGACSEDIAVLWHDINGWLIPGLLILAIVSLTDRDHVSAVRPSTGLGTWSPGPTIRHATIAVTALSVCLTLNLTRLPGGDQTAEHRFRVATQIEAIPYCVGNWLGVAGTMHEEELRILKPVASFRREYCNVDNARQLSFVAVFTGEAHDLVGHEPGICLVGQGWKILRQRPVTWQLKNVTVRGRDYVFRSGTDGPQKRVVSILIVADGQTSGNIDTVAEAAADFRRAPFGACSIQVSSDSDLTDGEWSNITEQFATQLQPVLAAFEECHHRGSTTQLASHHRNDIQ